MIPGIVIYTRELQYGKVKLFIFETYIFFPFIYKQQGMITNNSVFSEWYHYLFLALWLIILMMGLKYYPEIDKKFRLKNSSANKSSLVTGFLLSSFILGFIVFFMQAFFAEAQPAAIITYFAYGIFVMLLMTNAYFCLSYYVAPGSIIRLVLLSILIIIYFYSGLLGGLLMITVFSLVVIIYAFIKFKHILTIN